jgi:hypothetical protein
LVPSLRTVGARSSAGWRRRAQDVSSGVSRAHERVRHRAGCRACLTGGVPRHPATTGMFLCSRPLGSSSGVRRADGNGCPCACGFRSCVEP